MNSDYCLFDSTTSSTIELKDNDFICDIKGYKILVDKKDFYFSSFGTPTDIKGELFSEVKLKTDIFENQSTTSIFTMEKDEKDMTLIEMLQKVLDDNKKIDNKKNMIETISVDIKQSYNNNVVTVAYSSVLISIQEPSRITIEFTIKLSLKESERFKRWLE